MTRRVPIRLNNFYSINGTGSQFNIDIAPCQRPPKKYHHELLFNASMIKDFVDSPIYIMYSGGIDSEYVLNIFLECNIPIIPVIIKLSDYNNHDLYFAKKFCEERNLTPLTVDIDFDQFVENGEFLSIVKKYDCLVYQYAALIYAMEKLDGTIIIGEFEPHFSKKESWVLDEYERMFCLEKWFEINNIDGTPSFLNWSSETLLAFMNDGKIKGLLNNEYDYGRIGSNFLKSKIYNRFSYLSDRKKNDGYENIRISNIFLHKDLQDLILHRDDYSYKGNGYFSIDSDILRKNLEQKIL